MKINFSHPAFTGEDGKEIVFRLEGEMAVCPTCNGTGSHVRHDLDDSRMVDSMREDGDDEGLERYFAGAFDECCTQCGGKNVVAEPILDDEMAKEIDDWHQAEWEYRRECEAERRMGA